MASTFLTVLALSTGVFTILFSLLSVLAAWRFTRRSRSPHPHGSHLPPGAAPYQPPITVLKPIKGADAGLYATLASFLRQDYPRFQVLFCLQNPEDPALEVLRRLALDFPRADMEIVVSKSRIGYNPKINNLSNAYAFAKHEVVVISDSDIRVEPDFLSRVVAPLADPKVGMVTCYYRSGGAAGLGGVLEALSVNGQFLPQALAAGTLLGLRFAMGAVMLVRRQAFDAAGAFGALSHHLADDFVLGQALQALGWKIVFSDVVVESVPAFTSLTGHFAHLARWSRTIRVCQPWGYAGLFLVQGFPLLTLCLCLGLGSPAVLALWLCAAAARTASVGAVHSLLGRPIRRQLPFVPLSDLVQFAAWLWGFHSRAVLWRGEYYDISMRGLLVPRRSKRAAMLAVP